MARDSKIEVAGINLRIPEDKKRDYPALVKMLFDSREGHRVYGDSHLAMTNFDLTYNTGSIAKYTQIDLDGEWFDTATFDTASQTDVSKVNIPKNLKPNLSTFFFWLDADLHTIAFEKYSDSKALSLDAVKCYFDAALAKPNVVARFGRVEADIVNSHLAARKLLNQPNLKEIKVTIRLPNSDDVGDDLAAVIEERLRDQRATEYEETLKAKGQDSIKPNERTKKLAIVAAENGDVVVKCVVNGVMQTQKAAQTPLIEAEKYKANESTWPHFVASAKRLFSKIKSAREQVRG
ncbi:MAG: hypothetical protein CGW95_06365 [Phenylobacterium zucineum]|nr:MAG: hypothetical protein CGW95_06365 [Phenylobacterium zucineum]